MNKFFYLKTHAVAGPAGEGNAEAASGGSMGGGGAMGGSDIGGFSMDLGDGDRATVDASGNVTGFSGPGFSGSESAGELAAQAAALDAAAPSVFGQKLQDKLTSGKVQGGLLGLLGGMVIGQPALGAKIGSFLGENLFDNDAEKGRAAPSAPSAPGATQSQPGAATISALGQQGVQMGALSPSQSGMGELGGQRSEGGGGATQIAAAGRQSGIAPPTQQPLGQQPPVVPAQRFLNTQGPLPTVNLGAFPSIIGRA